MKQTVHLLIKGKVQGVFFRATAKDVANRTGVTGWIKNTREGNVEALVSGEEKAVGEFITWCKTGPSRAIVDDVEISERALESFNNFEVRK